MSLITKIEYGKMSTLVLADAENSEISSVFDANEDFNFSSYILALGHHGSKTSFSEDLFDEIMPQIAIISCGEGNSYGHPHKEVTDYLEEVAMEYYRTDLVGDITVITDGEKFNIKAER